MGIAPNSPPSVSPSKVRYIKLGREGGWENECIENGIIRIGYASGDPDRYAMCISADWDAVTTYFSGQGKDKGTSTRFANELRLFFEDPGSTLWITFVGDQLYWGLLESAPALPHADGNGVWRKVAGGWKGCDILSTPLTKDRLAGSLTKLTAYRGTSCTVDVADYVIRRINATTIPEVERAVAAQVEMISAVSGMIRLLEPKDFEVLVDLIFTTSGWRRQGVVGKTQKTLDLDLILPSTGERALVQVKSRTNTAELDAYIKQFDELGSFDRLFFIHHTGEANTEDERVVVIGVAKLSEMALEAGLSNWLIRKVS